MAIASSVVLPSSPLILNPVVGQEIEAVRRSSRPVWLGTEADEFAVEPLAKQPSAAGFVAADDGLDLVGRAKTEDLVGEVELDYVGDDGCGGEVCASAQHAVAVEASDRLARKVRRIRSDATPIKVPTP